MKRRESITLLGGAAAWSLAARAQQAEQMRRIGVLINLAADDPVGPPRITAFAQGLQESGWNVGRNVRIDYRKLLREKWRNRHPNAPPNFYDVSPNRPTRTFH
jgi:hypothetical protein